MTERSESVAVVVVTYNRADLLGRTLDGLAAQTHEPDAVIVVDNASTDHTREVLDAHPGVKGLHLQRIHLDENTGGAGGFRAGVESAYDQGFDRIWLMDDDVVPAPDCLAVLMAQDDAFVMAVREDTHGRLVEKAATDFDLTHARSIRPKRRSIETDFGNRLVMPHRVELHNRTVHQLGQDALPRRLANRSTARQGTRNGRLRNPRQCCNVKRGRPPLRHRSEFLAP